MRVGLWFGPQRFHEKCIGKTEIQSKSSCSFIMKEVNLRINISYPALPVHMVRYSHAFR